MPTNEPRHHDQRPVILLLGAEGEVTQQHLTEVGKELKSLREVFEPYALNNHTLFRFAYDPDLTQSELKDYLDQLAGKLSVLHFAGHSDGEVLQTDDLQVYAERIADIIKVWSSPPDLIFLNGCQNEGQVDAFHAAGVPVVIATSEKVNDAVAADFAGEFYKSLLGSDETSLHAAFTAAKQKMQLSAPNKQLPVFSTSEPRVPSSSDDSDRSPNLATVHARADQLLLPWLLYAQAPEQENWTLRQLLTQKRPVLGEDRQPINAYKGLEAFTESDSGFFFGRESLIEELTKNIAELPLVTLLGASGSGKSSLINAGVIPKLSDSQEWQIVSAKPGDDPFAGLANALSAAQLVGDASIEELQKEIRQEKGVLRFFTKYLADDSSQKKVLLFIDQFEELFTQSESKPEVVEAFQQQLYELVEVNLSNCHVVLVMRADFLPDALDNANFARLLNRNLDLKLAAMDEPELRAAINSPAKKQRVMIEPALLETLLRAVENQTGSLPLLQDILHQLWEQRESPYLITLNEYNQLGGLKKALENRADKFLTSLSDEHQRIVQAVFSRLIKTGSGTEDTRKRAYLREFEGNATAKGIIQQLVNERLVMTEQTSGDDGYVEISHEALIKNWGSLRKWIDSDRDNIRVRNQLTAAAQNWEDHKGDASWLMTGSRLVAVEDLFERGVEQANPLEKKFFNVSVSTRKKKKRRTYSIVSGVIVTLSLIAAVAVWQWYEAETARIATGKEVLEKNYKLAKVFEEKSLASISEANDDIRHRKKNLRKSIIYALEAKNLNIPEGRESLSKETVSEIMKIQVDEIFDIREQLYSSNERFLSIAYNEEKNSFAIGSKDGYIHIFDADSREITLSFKAHNSPINTIKYSKSGKFVSSGSGYSYEDKNDNIGNELKVWDVENKKNFLNLEDNYNSVRSISYCDEGILVSGSWDGTVVVYNFDLMTKSSYPVKEGVKINSVACSNSIIAAGLQDGSLIFIDSKTGDIIHQIENKENKIYSVSYNIDGSLIAAGGSDHILRVWDTKTKKLLMELAGHRSSINTIVFSPNGENIATGSGSINDFVYGPLGIKMTGGSSGNVEESKKRDNTVRLWDIRTGNQKKVFDDFPGGLSDIVYSSSGDVIYTVSEHGMIKIIDAKLNYLNKNIEVLNNMDLKRINAFSFSKKSNILAIAYKEDGIRVIDLDSDSEVVELRESQDLENKDILFDEEGRLFSSSYEKVISQWDINNGSIIREYKVNIDAFPNLGDFLASNILADSDSKILVGGMLFGKTLIFNYDGTVKHLLDTSFPVVGIPGTKNIMAMGSNGIEVWDINIGKKIRTIDHDTGSMTWDLKVNSSGSKVATCSDDSVKIYDIKTGASDFSFELDGAPQSCDFHPEKNWILIGSTNGNVEIRDANTGVLISSFVVEGVIYDVSYNKDGTYIAIAKGNGDFHVQKENKEMISLLNNFNSDALLIFLKELWGFNLNENSSLSIDGKKIVNFDFNHNLPRFLQVMDFLEKEDRFLIPRPK